MSDGRAQPPAECNTPASSVVFASIHTMLASTRLCMRVANRLPGAKSSASRPSASKTQLKPKRTLIASVRSQQLHTSAATFKMVRAIEPVKPQEPEIALDGDIVPQSRLNDILAHLGEDDNVPILQETRMELEPFAVNEVLDVGRHTKILPGTCCLNVSNTSSLALPHPSPFLRQSSTFQSL